MDKQEKIFKIQQLEKQLESVARMARAYPYQAKWQKKLNYIQTRLAQLRSAK